MRVFVKVCIDGSLAGQTYVVPCNEPGACISVLKSQALARWCENNCIKLEERNADDSKLALSANGALLSDKDVIKEVLQDGEFVELCPIGEVAPSKLNADCNAKLPVYGPATCQALSNIEYKEVVELDGYTLTVDLLMKIGRGELKVKVSESAVEAINKSRKVVDDLVAANKVVYGITTGFGKFANIPISREKTGELQENLIRSHAAGVGRPLTPEQTRRLLALRLNVLARGFSGARLETVQKLEAALNVSCLPLIPEQGTVGASGDLAPLAHLALGLMGEGLMWSPTSGWADAANVLKAHGLSPISLKAKEGLALINGTQLITALGTEALYRAELIAKQADVVAALTLETLEGTPKAFDYDIHANRPHEGQQLSARALRALLDSKIHPSEIMESHRDCGRVQDAYSLRCIPQVHGIVYDTLKFVKVLLTTEMNSALDNPMVFAERNETVSGGNFHGEYPAKAADYLAIAVHELANISERRVERMINPHLDLVGYEGGVNLPAFLVAEGGINSGFMIAHCTAAALTSENKVLTHPASSDTLSTSAASEDHVSMGGFSARKAISVVSHVEQVLAIELLAACQALEFHHKKSRTTTAPLEDVYKLVRTVVRPWDKDRYMAPDIESATKLLREGKIWDTVEPYITHYLNEAGEPPLKQFRAA